MNWLQSLDAALFRFINQTLSNTLFDCVMPLFAGGPWFLAATLLTAALIGWKGGVRGRIFLLMLVLSIAVTDGVICKQMKELIGRPRPFIDIPETHLLVGAGGSGSMPSSHAANWFAALMVTTIYFRRRAWIVGLLTAMVALSRVVTGVHYPSDVIVGALIGAASGIAVVLGANGAWSKLGRRWFPRQWNRHPSLLCPELAATPAEMIEEKAADSSDSSVRVGYLIIAITLLARLWYLASDTIELSEDETYQWLWSKHLDLSYYSKPPMIAYAQFLGTWLWGDTQFGVRFLSPVLAAILSFILLRFLSREANARVGLAVVLVAIAAPLLSVGSILMTVDPLAASSWALAMIAGWRAIKRDSTRQWLLVGFWMGMGFLSKYTTPFQLVCWVVFFLLWPPARSQLRRPGPWLALLICAACTLPVIVWNAQHGWITVTHLAERGGLDQRWEFKWRFLLEFVGAEWLLLNPILFIGMIWAGIALWRRPKDPLIVFCFSMGAPVFLFYLFYTLRARVLPNWIAPVILPMLMMTVLFWEARWREGNAAVKRWFVGALAFGLPVVVLLHDTSLIGKFTGQPLPPPIDPLVRVRRNSEEARIIGDEWRRLNAEGTPAFIIGAHYGLVGLTSFYLPEAKRALGSGTPLVYYYSTDVPHNQFYFWPGYSGRKGQNAVFVADAGSTAAPERLMREFHGVSEIGVRDVKYKDGRVFNRLRFFVCRGLQ